MVNNRVFEALSCGAAVVVRNTRTISQQRGSLTFAECGILLEIYRDVPEGLRASYRDLVALLLRAIGWKSAQISGLCYASYMSRGNSLSDVLEIYFSAW